MVSVEANNLNFSPLFNRNIESFDICVPTKLTFWHIFFIITKKGAFKSRVNMMENSGAKITTSGSPR